VKKHIIYMVLILLFIAGNVYQGLHPRVEVKEVVKYKTKIQKDVKIVEVIKKDGTRIITTEDKSRTETNKDTKSETKPKPIPLNSVYLGINPRVTTDLELVYGRRVFGPFSVFVSGSVDLVEKESRFHAGAGFQF